MECPFICRVVPSVGFSAPSSSERKSHPIQNRVHLESILQGHRSRKVPEGRDNGFFGSVVFSVVHAKLSSSGYMNLLVQPQNTQNTQKPISSACSVLLSRNIAVVCVDFGDACCNTGRNLDAALALTGRSMSAQGRAKRRPGSPGIHPLQGLKARSKRNGT